MMMLRLARSSLAGSLIGWIFAHMSFAIPVQRLRETTTLVAFHHPSPSHPIHILLVPKKAVHSLVELSPGEAFTQTFLADLLQCVQSLVAEYRLSDAGYRLIVNGGEYQDVPQLHFHLISGHGK